MKKPALLFLLPLFLLGSCASDSGSSSAATSAPAKKSLTDRLSGETGYGTNSEGQWVAKSEKRSSFERGNRDSAYFKGDYSKKGYETKKFAKQSWWGDTKYESKSYQGDTDGSRFQTNSRLQGQGAREAGNSARLPGEYRTGDYATNSAREAGSSRLSKPSDAETDVRRRVYTPPAVIDWREQRNMSIGETKSLLGR